MRRLCHKLTETSRDAAAVVDDAHELLGAQGFLEGVDPAVRGADEHAVRDFGGGVAGNLGDAIAAELNVVESLAEHASDVVFDG